MSTLAKLFAIFSPRGQSLCAIRHALRSRHFRHRRASCALVLCNKL
jgi:hypothetical protein